MQMHTTTGRSRRNDWETSVSPLRTTRRRSKQTQNTFMPTTTGALSRRLSANLKVLSPITPLRSASTPNSQAHTSIERLHMKITVCLIWHSQTISASSSFTRFRIRCALWLSRASASSSKNKGRYSRTGSDPRGFLLHWMLRRSLWTNESRSGSFWSSQL